MNLLVTGGAGFIGSHLCEQLVRDGHAVTVIDDLNDFYDPAAKLENLAAVQQLGSVPFIRADVRDVESVRRVVAETRPDAVVHLAARAGVRPSLDDPLLYEDVNVRGTLAVLEACRRAEVGKFVFASSSSVYGATGVLPFTEADTTDLPLSPYGATKIAGEKLCHVYAHLFGMHTVCLRLFTVYGPRQRPDLAIRRFVEAIDAGRPITVYGDGSSARDYTHVSDIVGGIVSALRHDAAFDVFNLGSTRPVTLTELVASVERALARTADVRRLPLQPGDVPLTFADISKAHAALGYAPRMDFEAGIRDFVAWHRATARSSRRRSPSPRRSRTPTRR